MPTYYGYVCYGSLLIGLIGVLFTRVLRWALFLGMAMFAIHYTISLIEAGSSVLFFWAELVEPYLMGALLLSLFLSPSKSETMGDRLPHQSAGD